MPRMTTKDYPLKLEIKVSEAVLTAMVAKSVARLIKGAKKS